MEESNDLAPKFDDRGLITVVTTDADSGEVLMQGYMNAEALSLTISDRRSALLQPQPQKSCGTRGDEWIRAASPGIIRR